MTFDRNWQPTPELLAAYFDGECEGSDALSALKQHIEAWLAAHPEAQQDLADYRHLRQTWQQTTPAEPSAKQWADVLARIEPMVAHGMARKQRTPAPYGARLAWSTLAAAVACVIMYFAWPHGEIHRPAIANVEPAKVEDDEVLPVVGAGEVTIVRVEGADTQTLVVGALPLEGAIELVSRGEISVTLIRPHALHPVQPVRLIESSSPMIWAKLESDQDLIGMGEK